MVAAELSDAQLALRRNQARPVWLWAGLVLVTATTGLPAAHANSFSTGTLVQVSGPDPFTACTADDVSGQAAINFPNSEVEPWVDVNPVNPGNIVGTWQQDRWSDGGSRGLVAGVSFDGGGTWSPVVVPKLTVCSGGTLQRASDPWLSFGPTGTLHHSSLSFNTVNSGENGILASKSTDGGLTWSDPLALIDDTDSSVLNDKDSITADPTDSNFVYAVWDRLQSAALRGRRSENLTPPRFFALASARFQGPSYFARSTDGGQSWEPARNIVDPGTNNQTIGNQIVVLPNGTLVNVFDQIRPASSPRFSTTASIVRSTDRGMTWQPARRPIKAARIQARSLFAGSGVYAPETGDPVRTGDIIPEIAVDQHNGNLYLVWEDARFSNKGKFSDPSLLIDEIAFAMSTNGGTHWSKPIKINKTPTNSALGNRQAFTPAIHVAADGTIAVTYYDFRFNDAGADLKTDYFVVHCDPSSAKCSNANNWTDEIRLTDSSFDMRQAPNAEGFFVGDYEALTAVGNDFIAFFAQAGNSADPSSIFARRLSAP